MNGTLDATTAEEAPAGVAPSEANIATATVVAPSVLGAVTPFLAPEACVLLGGGTAAWATASGAAYTGALSDQALASTPGGDILKAHAAPMLVSSLASGVALTAGGIGGPLATEMLMAGFLNPMTVPGIVSLGWWAMTGVVTMKLRRVLRPAKPQKAKTQEAPSVDQRPPEVIAKGIVEVWAQHISREGGTHPGQELELLSADGTGWSGRIVADPGKVVKVSRETVSSVYRVPAGQVEVTDGGHAGEKNIRVDTTVAKAEEVDTSTLAGMWRKRVARKGGVLEGTHLEDVRRDPVTGGEVALVVADEDTDSIPQAPALWDLAGALRTSPVLVSFEAGDDPRRAVVRRMKENPLRAGVPFAGPHMLTPSEGGFFRVGTAVSGLPVRVQLLNPRLGARHMLVCGVTGAGKGGVLQLVALGAHLAGSSIIYADPKGSSNPSIEEMAAYSGLGEDGAMGALRVAHALLKHRVAMTAKLKLKNFDRTRMPHVVVVVDETSSLTGEGFPTRKEAAAIISAIAAKGRSLGISLVLANQILNLDQLGGAASIRDNVVHGGGLILLRSDSSQKNLVDQPPGMEGCDPRLIPASWNKKEVTLVYDDSVALSDPESTEGLGYFMTADGVAAMARSISLEDASPYVNHGAVVEPWDWPEWESRYEIASHAPEDAEEGAGGSLGGFMAAAPKETASEKVLRVLEEWDPEELPVSVHDLEDATSLAAKTVANTVSELEKAGKIVRQGKGYYAPADFA